MGLPVRVTHEDGFIRCVIGGINHAITIIVVIERVNSAITIGVEGDRNNRFVV